MIINHNLAGSNAIRQMNTNSANASSSMQKLSSGLRINKAGDDAAGLSISEKMKGQIRGLDQASNNAQDGISMTQTAEGALSETTSILQRMRELAVQSSNDTNTGDDRTAIQTEMNQLSSEVNRIGNTTEFNTQKVLNGGNQVKTNATISGANLTNGTAVVTSGITEGAMSNGTNATAAALTGGSTAALTTNLSSVDSDASMTIKVDGKTFTVANSDIKALTGSQNITNTKDLIANAVDSDGNKLSTVANVTDDGSGKVVITTKSTLGTGSNVTVNYQGAKGADKTAMATATGIAEAGTAAGTDATKATQVETFNSLSTEGTTLTLANGKKVALFDSVAGAFKNSTDAKAGLNADYVIDINGATTSENVIDKIVAGVDASSGYTLTKASTTTLEIKSNTAGALAVPNLAVKGADVTTATAAKGFVQFTDTPQQGSSITIGGKTIGFYDSSKEGYNNDVSAKDGLGTDMVIDTKGLNASQVVDKLVNSNTAINGLLTNGVTLSKEVVADGSVKLNVVASTTGFKGNLTTLDKSADTTEGFKATLQIGANTAQNLTLGIADMRADALNITGTTGSATVKAKDGAVASYVSTANVTDGTSSTNTEFSLDISTNKKATAAISVLDDAISTVSAERSKLGAVQNRLEHTINNLGTSSENLTSAQSRITDVDMAKEMATFSKNNILSQAAQAMLAQANTQPQQVLQLLR